jgi:crossover junction endodeoxyribonuclease RuvC
MPYALGIDPGVSGAVAAVDLLGTGSPRVDVFDLPALELHGKNRLDLHATWSLIQGLAAGAPDVCVIEETHGRPIRIGGKVVRANPHSAHVLGQSTGQLQGCIVAAGLRLEPVEPSVWKKALGATADKDLTRLIASRLFPQFAHQWHRKKDHNRAEAVLLAWYGLTNVLGVAS